MVYRGYERRRGYGQRRRGYARRGYERRRRNRRGRGGPSWFGLLALAVVLVVLWQSGFFDRWTHLLEELPRESGTAEAVEVVRVIDGDTLIVDRDGAEERVRVLGIDAPEVARDGSPGEPCAAEATALTERLTDGGEVEVITDPSQSETDRYGRTLAYVEADGRDVSAELLREGLAEVYESAPDIDRYTEYEELAATAAVPGCASE